MIKDTNKEDDKVEGAAWARNEYEELRRAKQATAEAQKRYNETLTAVDTALKIPAFRDIAADILKLQSDLNQIYRINESLHPDTGKRFAWPWWKYRISPIFWLRKLLVIALKPLLQRQQNFNAVTVHYLNEVTTYLSAMNQKQRERYKWNAAFLLEITPWTDAKIRQAQFEQNYNVAYHHGLIIHEHLNRALQDYNENLQKQLQSLYFMVQPIRVLEQQTLQVRSEMEDLWHAIRRADGFAAELLKAQESQGEKIQTAIDAIETAALSRSQSEESRREIESLQERIQHLTRLIEGFEERYYPAIRVEGFELERLKEDIRQLKENAQSPGNGNGPTYPASPKHWEFPRARDLRYAAFEEIFRGSSKWLKDKMNVYVRYFQNAEGPVIDIGCGRGEFLELMSESGKNAYGVETNEYSANKLREKGLNVVIDDALNHLTGLKDQSLGGAFCAQVVEHLLPEDVYKLVSLLNKKMKQGAPLIIETINPLSIQAFHEFYMVDPTHIYPVHPKTMVFFLRYAGFHNVQIEKLSAFPSEVLLPAPADALEASLKQYLGMLVSRLNQMFYNSAEYFVTGNRP